MQLYITPTSPFAWMVRIVVLEKGLTDRVAFLRARTRTPGSWYYDINPSGRVPFLLLENGIGFEESDLIIRYLDHIDHRPIFDHPQGEAGWDSRSLEARARSLIDGLCVWSRELNRSLGDQSAGIITHEQQRARRLTDWWEGEITNPLMTGPLNLAQITLICALKLEHVNIDLDWRDRCASLAQWADQLMKRKSIAIAAPNGPGDFFNPPAPVFN